MSGAERVCFFFNEMCCFISCIYDMAQCQLLESQAEDLVLRRFSGLKVFGSKARWTEC